ncbi:MAG: TetR/AcrR family transcriptional regulator [Solirubrobacterales bacterium]|jgi:AcrR family transcriptional regulator|nr:TetR/AcrR family transcriptional regulator [Solirubrobacterales bacterium]
MSEESPSAPKQRLLDELLVHLERHGLSDTSLRGLAKAVGSSHRMLSYHFGSRQELLTEVSRTVERQQRDAFRAMLADPSRSPVEVMRTMYERFVDPSLRRPERLFFELYARALLDPAGSAFVPEVVEAWLDPLVELFARLGLEDAAAAAEARLAIAVSRGLLLDLLATEDREAVHAAMERYMLRFEPETESD